MPLKPLIHLDFLIDKMLKRNEKLIKTKFLQYLLPSIMTTVAMQIGNVVDTILVGNILGTDAMSAVQIGSIVLMFIQIPGYMLGLGGQIAVGNLLGKRDMDGARKIFSVSMTATVLTGMIFMLFAPFSHHIAIILSGDGALTESVAAVVRTELIGAPIIGIALQLMNYLAVDNHPRLSTAYVIMSNIVNLAADYLLLSRTNIGVAGAAWSTIIGYAAALVVLYPYVSSDKRMLSFVNPFAGSKESFILAFNTGMPAMLSIVCVILRNWAMNLIIFNKAGEEAIAVYTVALNVIMICELFLGGIIDTMSTIGGVLNGERDRFGLRSLSKNILKYSYSLLAVLIAVLFVFTPYVANLFGIKDAGITEITVTALRIFTLCLPFYIFNRFMTLYYQTTGKLWISNLIMLMEYNVVLLPAACIITMIASKAGGSVINAIMLSFIIGEAVTAGVAVLVVLIRYKSGVMVVGEDDNEDVLDMSLECDIKEAMKVPVAIKEFFEGKIDPSLSNKIAVAAEEMTVNIIKHGMPADDTNKTPEKVKSIDVMTCIKDDAIMLRIRDNGIHFDPTDYTCDDDDYEFGGIDVVKKLSDGITYMRTLDLNNTTILFGRRAF